MSKSEFIDWAMEDIIVSLNDNVDIVESWFVGSKDCRCPITKQINDAVEKLINRYDFVIFDCEFDLKYLNQLVDIEIDSTIIVANPSEESAHLAKRIKEFSEKHAAGNQLGVVINKVDNSKLSMLSELLRKYELDILGVIPYDENLETHSVDKESELVRNAVKSFYPRLNLPQ
jgi:CO dehydrogenase maturation factor